MYPIQSGQSAISGYSTSPAEAIQSLEYQLYWLYGYSDYLDKNGDSVNFDSYIEIKEDLEKSQ